MKSLADHPRLQKYASTLIHIGHETWQGFLLVFRITFPIILGIRILEEFFPLVDYVGDLLSPLMEILGLPGTAGLAWAAAILLQPISGFAIVAERWNELQLTAAQATIFGMLVIEVHSILVEVRIAQMLGVRAWVTYVMRFGFAIGLCMLIDSVCRHYNLLQEPAELLFVVGESDDNSWQAWFWFQFQAWSYFAVVLYAITLLMHLIRVFKIEQFLIWLLTPFMAVMGIHRNATSVSLLGLVMGISFGAALIMAEIRKGAISSRDLLLSVSLLGICHALIEDTALPLLFGANFFIMLFVRLFFSMLVIGLLARIIKLIPEQHVEKYMMLPVNTDEAALQRI